MARVTVEDCVQLVPNRFELVMVSAQRARDIHAGQEIKVDRDNDKNPVVALREIADTTIAPQDLKEDLIHSLQKYVEVDEPEQAEQIAGLIGSSADSGREDDEMVFDQISEEDLLRGLESMVPPEKVEDI